MQGVRRGWFHTDSLIEGVLRGLAGVVGEEIHIGRVFGTIACV